jgi:2-hydroxy-3-keto-5-methylthiopentenyl-1-phosphate phosphatase
MDMSLSEAGWSVVCDFDGTISTIDVTDRLLELLARPQWLAIEDEWRSGKIGSWECLDRQIALVRAKPHEIDALADTISIDPHFFEFANFCASRSVPLAIASDGLDRIISRVLANNGLGSLPIYSNALWQTSASGYRLLSPHWVRDCRARAATCKCAVVDSLRSHAARVLFVGDGRSDFCVAAGGADMVAAKAKLLEHLNASGHRCVPFKTFHDVQKLLASLLHTTADVATEPELVHEHH